MIKQYNEVYYTSVPTAKFISIYADEFKCKVIDSIFSDDSKKIVRMKLYGESNDLLRLIRYCERINVHKLINEHKRNLQLNEVFKEIEKDDVLSSFEAGTHSLITHAINDTVFIEMNEACIVFWWIDNLKDATFKLSLYDAISGRIGKRTIEFVPLCTDVMSVWIQRKKDDEVGDKFEVKDIDEFAGNIYVVRNSEIRAIKVTRDNYDELVKFTGGGKFLTNRYSNSVATYTFVSNIGMIVEVPENHYIIRTSDGSIRTMEASLFEKEYSLVR